METHFAGSGEKLNQTVKDLNQTAKDKVSDLTQSAADRLERGRMGTAETLESAATAVRTKGGEAGAAITDLSGRTATNLDNSARYVRNTNLGQVWSDVSALARQHPGAIAFTGIVAGLCMGRMITRRSRCSHEA